MLVSVRVLPLVAGLVVGRGVPVEHLSVRLALHQKLDLDRSLTMPQQSSIIPRQAICCVWVLCQESSLRRLSLNCDQSCGKILNEAKWAAEEDEAARMLEAGAPRPIRPFYPRILEPEQARGQATESAQ